MMHNKGKPLFLAFLCTFLLFLSSCTETSQLLAGMSMEVKGKAGKEGGSKICGETIAGKHVHEYWLSESQDPTCLDDGFETYACKCGISYTRYCSALGHEEEIVVVEPTKESDGYTRHTCLRCGDFYDTDIVTKLPSVSFAAVNQTVWTTAAINVRNGPGTEFAEIGSLGAGTVVKRTGIGDNGWSKIEFNGQEGYVASDSIQDQEQVQFFDGSSVSADVAARLADSGATGVLYIPDIGFTPVNCFLYSRGNNEMQAIADAENSAYIVGVYHSPDVSIHKIEIGDHVHQNFGVLRNVTPGMRAYFNLGSAVIRMTCVENTTLSLADCITSTAAENGMVITTCCSGSGARTVVRWVIDSDSDLSFEDFYNNIISQGTIIHYN